jgi:alkylhydroperoxidase family enzyme
VPRIKPITDKADVPEDRHAEFDAVLSFSSRTAFLTGGPLSILLYSPGLAQKFGQVGGHLRANSTVSPIQREISILAVAREKDVAFVWNEHVHASRAIGVREEVIDAVRSRADVNMLDPDERDIILFVRQLAGTNRVEPAVFDSLLMRHDQRWVVELTALIGQYQYVSGILNAFEITPPADADPLPVDPQTARLGG